MIYNKDKKKRWIDYVLIFLLSIILHLLNVYELDMKVIIVTVLSSCIIAGILGTISNWLIKTRN
ncbi:hypothetical protein SH1V18_21600 [Vallitalea longa]|uniref:Uncharacterized protein n=1 Tax=Vallitalea longa TaxID=2936439 RepID=A0A9W5Y9D7_9FIRM|nr:hypothetical protein [Vallitalea longa]GKX29680.1 hypothetical protein SH1V18_21600 [Vallitalea longa]